MLSKKFFIGVAVFSFAALVCPHYSHAVRSSSPMYGSVGGSFQFPTEHEYKVLDNGFYIQGMNASGVYVDGYKPIYQYGGAIASVMLGMHFPGVRAELEGHYLRASPKDSGEEYVNNPKFQASAGGFAPQDEYVNKGISSWALLLNAYYDIGGMGSDNSIMPYFGGGFGPAYPDFNGKNMWALAYQAKFGVTVAVGEYSRVYVGYKYLNLLGQETGYEGVVAKNGNTHNIEVPYSSQNIEVGLIISFSQ